MAINIHGVRGWMKSPTYHGEIADIYVWYSKDNAKMHFVIVAMSNGTLV
jgi:hypothetical protein